MSTDAAIIPLPTGKYPKKIDEAADFVVTKVHPRFFFTVSFPATAI